jgi:DNA-directed RNA polymerase beta' subunit
MTLHRTIPTAAPSARSIEGFESIVADDAVADNIEALARLVVRRRGRLERLRRLHAPPIMLRNERRMLRDAINALCASATSRPRFQTDT